MKNDLEKAFDLLVSENRIRLSEIRDDVKLLQKSVNDLHSFKIELKTEARISARNQSLLIGAISILLNMVLHFL